MWFKENKTKIIRVLILSAVVVLGFLFILSGCSSKNDFEVIESDKLKIVTTFTPLYSHAARIVGDRALLTNILPENVGPHDYSFTPSNVKIVSEADVIIQNGLDLENWLSSLIEQANAEGILVIDSSNNIDVISSGELGKDPHIWLSPKQAILQVQNISSALITKDPLNEKIYRANTETYLAELELLDQKITSQIDAAKEKKFVAFHDSFSYFARDYGLDQIAVIEEIPGEQPSAKFIAELGQIIKDNNLKVIYSEKQFSNKLAERLAADLEIEVVPLDTLETGALSAETYLKAMEENLNTLIKYQNQ